jgi:hypothetical protein
MTSGKGPEPADRLFRCGIFPSGWGNIPISRVRIPISLRVAKQRSRLASLARELLGRNRIEETRRDGG